MSDYVTSTGFIPKTFEEIKSEHEDIFRSAYGEEIDLESDSPAGQLIGILSNREINLWNAAQEIYTSRNPNEAIGVSLDNIATENNLIRLPATSTQITSVALYGDDAATANDTDLRARSSPQSEILYKLPDATIVTIDYTALTAFEFSIDDTTITDIYSITIDTTTYQIVNVSDDKRVLLDALADEFDGVSSIAAYTTGQADEARLTLIFATSIDNTDVSTSTEIIIERRGISVILEAVDTGPISAPANSIVELVAPPSGITGINNPVQGTLGTDIESDTIFRIRRLRDLASLGKGTDTAIRVAIGKVEGVVGVIVVSNRSDVTDSDGRPPHTFEAIVSGGDDDEIAQAIFDTRPAGINSYGEGTTSGTAIDDDGETFTIFFSRPVNVPIQMQIDISLYDEEAFPAPADPTGIDAVRTAVYEWTQDITNIDIGKDIIPQRFSTPIYSVPGIGQIEVRVRRDSDPYSTDIIEIIGREIATFINNQANIEVTII